MIKSDIHLHSDFSNDSKSPMEDMIKQGIALGLKVMCFTEHQDFDYPIQEEGIAFQLDINAYEEKLLYLKEKYKSQIEILFGVELGIEVGTIEKVRDFSLSRPFDFIIASAHLIDGVDPYYGGYFNKYSEKEGIVKYFQSISQCLDLFDNFHTLGHLDYIVRYASQKNKNYKPQDYQEIIDEILIKLISRGKGLEINTSGIKYGLNQTHPHIDIIRRYKELGGEIVTIGSDAHQPIHIGHGFDYALEILQEVGFSHYTIFKKGVPQNIYI